MIVILTNSEVGYGVWGKGSTKAEAMKQARKHGGKPSKHGYTMLEFASDDDFRGVDQMGRVHYMTEPVIREFDSKGREDK